MERAQGEDQQRETMQKVGVSVRRRCGTLPLPNYYRHLLHIDVRGLALPSEQLPYCPCQRPFSHVSRHMSPRRGQPTTAPDDVRLNDVSADTSMSGHPTTAHTHTRTCRHSLYQNDDDNKNVSSARSRSLQCAMAACINVQTDNTIREAI